MKQGDAIALENNREYLCFDTAELDGKHYVFLISVEEPTDICFAEACVFVYLRRLLKRLCGNPSWFTA